MKISIIVPVFNASKYLKRCLDSILDSLGNTDGEVLVIDNNSTDNSLEVLKSYHKKDSRVNVLQCATPGAAAVKNYGVKKAKGEFVWFIDADDSIDKTAVSKLLAAGKGNDIVMMGANRIGRDGSVSYLSAVDKEDKNYKSRFVRYGMGPWQVIIRREWWNKNGFAFREGIIHEDMELMSSLILHTDRYNDVDEPLYYYYNNPDSVLHKKEFSPHIFDIFPALEGLYQHFVDAGAGKKYHDELEWFFIWNLLIDSAKDFASFPEGKPGFKRSREMMKEDFPNWKQNRFLKEKPIKFRIRVRLNFIS